MLWLLLLLFINLTQARGIYKDGTSSEKMYSPGCPVGKRVEQFPDE